MNIFHIHCYCCIKDTYRKCIISRWIETMMVHCTCFIYPYVYHKPCGFVSRDLVSFLPDLWYYSLHIWPIYHFCSIPYCHEDVMKWKHFPRYGPMWREFSSDQWIPLTEASGAELWCFLWSVTEQTIGQAIETPVIWDIILLIMTLL